MPAYPILTPAQKDKLRRENAEKKRQGAAKQAFKNALLARSTPQAFSSAVSGGASTDIPRAPWLEQTTPPRPPELAWQDRETAGVDTFVPGQGPGHPFPFTPAEPRSIYGVTPVVHPQPQWYTRTETPHLDPSDPLADPTATREYRWDVAPYDITSALPEFREQAQGLLDPTFEPPGNYLSDEDIAAIEAHPEGPASRAALAEAGLQPALTTYEKTDDTYTLGRSLTRGALMGLGPLLMLDPLLERAAAGAAVGVPAIATDDPRFEWDWNKLLTDPTRDVGTQRDIVNVYREQFSPLQRAAMEFGIAIVIPATPLEVAFGKMLATGVGKVTSPIVRKALRPPAIAEAAAPDPITGARVAGEGAERLGDIPRTVQRIEEPGVTPAFDKPQGLYTSPAGITSPHTDLGGKLYHYDIAPNARILSIEATELVRTNRGLVGQSAGVGALRNLVGEDEAVRFLALSKREAIEEMTRKYPDVQWARYVDTQEIAEGYAGRVAKERGYDAIWAIDQRSPGLLDSEFDELVILNKKIATPTTTAIRPRPPYVPEAAAPPGGTPPPPRNWMGSGESSVPPGGGVPPQRELGPVVIEATANRPLVADPPDLDRLISEVRTIQESGGGAKLISTLSRYTGVNPSALRRSPVGRILTARFRQQIAVDNLVSSTLQAGLDKHAARWAGRMRHILPIKRDGLFGDTGVPWQDIFTDPDNVKWASSLSRGTRDYIRDFHQIIREANEMLQSYGLKRIPLNQNGWFYVPRYAEEKFGVSFIEATDSYLTRIHEDAMDGYAAGIRYSNNPRATLQLHLRGAYKQVLEEDLGNHLEPLSLGPKDILERTKPDLRGLLRTTILNKKEGQATLRAAEKKLATSNATLRTVRAVSKTMPTTSKRAQNAARLIPQIQRGIRGQKAGIERAKENLRIWTAEYNKAKSNYKVNLTQVKGSKQQILGKLQTLPEDSMLWGPNQPDVITLRNWNEQFLPVKEFELLEAGLGTFENPLRTSTWQKATLTFANTIRHLSATLDFAEPFIQGLPLLAKDPAKWARASYFHYYAFFDPTVQARYVSNNLEDIQEAIQYGLVLGDSEFYSALEAGSGVSLNPLFRHLRGSRTGAIRPAARELGRQTFGRFQNAYNMGLTMARVDLWQAMKTNWVVNKGGSLDELAAYIRNLTGGLDSRSLSIGPNRRAIESMLLAFSPRLFRSTVALFADAVRPNTVRGRESLKSLGKLAGAIPLLYILIGKGMGRSDEEIKQGLNPLNGKRFLSYQVNGDWIGVGGQVRSISQFMARIIADPKSLAEPGLHDNPITAFYMGRGAVGFTAGGTIAEGFVAQFGGELDIQPYSTVDGVPDILNHMFKATQPFTLQGVLEGEETFTSLASGVGLRTSPETYGEEFTRSASEPRGVNGESIWEEVIREYPQYADEYRRLMEEPYKQWPDIVRNRVRDLPNIKEREKGFPPPRTLSSEESIPFRFHEYEQFKTDKSLELSDFLDGVPEGRKFRAKLRDIRDDIAGAAEFLLGSDDMQEFFKKDDEWEWVTWAQSYWGVKLKDHPNSKEPDYRQRDRDREDILAKAVEAGVDSAFITEKGEANYRWREFSKLPGLNDKVEKHDTDHEILREYWDLKSTAPGLSTLRSPYREEYEAWLNDDHPGQHPYASEDVKTDMESLVRKVYDRVITPARKRMRMERNDIDALLELWGYDEQWMY